MPQSLSQIYLHLIFSTKARAPLLLDQQLRARTRAYLAGACKKLAAPAVRVGGIEDHVHILCRMSRTLSVADLVKELKRESSKWIKSQPEGPAELYWQRGYGAFSVSPSHVATLTQYIDQQEQHHRSESYQDELRRICRKYGVDLDERYAWE